MVSSNYELYEIHETFCVYNVHVHVSTGHHPIVLKAGYLGVPCSNVFVCLGYGWVTFLFFS